MEVHINTDRNLKTSNEFLTKNEKFEKMIQDSLDIFQKYITKIEVRFSDVNADKVGFDDKRCFIEARINGIHPIVATHYANNMLLALDGAIVKLKNSLGHTLGKMKDR